jgi:dolichol kinase
MALSWDWPMLVATCKATGIALSVLVVVRVLRAAGFLSSGLARKALHSGIGPAFVLCWSLWPSEPVAAWWAAAVPGGIVAYFALVGLKLLHDPGTVDIMSRTDRASDLLVGPVEYGIMTALITCFAFKAPVAVATLSALFLGDAAAEVAGRAVQHLLSTSKRPGALIRGLASPIPGISTARKSVAGSAACVIASFAGAMLLLAAAPVTPADAGTALIGSRWSGAGLPHVWISLSAAVCGALAEAMTSSAHDNITATLGAAVGALACCWVLGA